ncbi:Hypothetical protein ETEE_0317 [Edwardsiella anguillarum ET080813]|uniref:Uncharacterized protein n=1 Tax=Edwardsiella anguillarum ET080813 TaxID=667120 RepID=A0A076LE58_9GAMM|nr:Hypothetical protein ETEE_0317 [Edwardsiella anguillarum ET080813]
MQIKTSVISFQKVKTELQTNKKQVISINNQLLPISLPVTSRIGCQR